MSKSLTEVAKAILMNESNDSAPDRGAKSMTPNAATLRPGSRAVEGRFSNPGASTTSPNQVQDLGPALVKQGDVPPSAKAAGAVAKDTSKSSKAPVASEKPKKQAEVMEEDFELDEEEQLDEISSELAGRAAFIAKNRAETAENQGKNRKAKAYQDQSDRLYDAAERKANKENDSDKEISSGKKAKMRKEEVELEEEIEISEELAAFIEEKLAEGLTEEEIAQAIDENFEFVSEDVEELAEEEYQVDMSEHVEALLSGEELSEEFKQKATTIFEAAVRQKVEEEIARLEEAYAEALEEEVAKVTESLTESVDDYLSYVAEQWVAENEVAIEHGLRTELTEEFISGLRSLFEENYIDIPEDKVSVVEELGGKVEELEAKLNEEIERNVALNKMINESKQYEILASACDGLTTTQVEKLKALSEGIEFTTDSEYASKIKTLRESYFTGSVNNNNVLDSVDEYNDGKTMIAESTNGRMAAYVRTIGKKLPN